MDPSVVWVQEFLYLIACTSEIDGRDYVARVVNYLAKYRLLSAQELFLILRFVKRNRNPDQQKIVEEFFNNFYTAVRPQIVKYYAQGDRESMLDLVFKSTKYSFFLCLIVSLPVLIEAPYLVHLWLGQTPEYTITFTRLIVVISIVDALAAPIMTAAHATGKIKLYQFVVGMITILNIPISYCALKYVSTNAVTVYVVSLALAVTAFVVRLWIVKRLVNFSIRLYFRTVILKILMLSALSVPLPLGLHLIMGNGFISSAVVIIVSVISSCVLIYTMGMSGTERAMAVNVVRNKIKQYAIGR